MLQAHSDLKGVAFWSLTLFKLARPCSVIAERPVKDHHSHLSLPVNETRLRSAIFHS